MGKKKAPVTLEAWCWYCDREFEDEKVLISHQRAKHFRCPQCPRRLNTAGGLAVHLQQVHKAEPTTLENTLPGRDTFDVEIYGMEGIPESDLMEWESRKSSRSQNQLEAAQVSKKPRIHKGVLSVETLTKQLEAFRRLRSIETPAGGTLGRGTTGPPPVPGMPGVTPGGPVGTGAAVAAASAAAAPSSAPQLPPAPPGPPPSAPHVRAQQEGAQMRLVYTDTVLSPEEKLALDPQYAYIELDAPYDTGPARPRDGVEYKMVPSSWGPPALGIFGLPPRPFMSLPLPPAPSEASEYKPHYPLHPAVLTPLEPIVGAAAQSAQTPPAVAGTKRARPDDLS